MTMKRGVRASLLGLVAALAAGGVGPTHFAEPQERPSETIDRPTSAPYTGNLSIFEGERRAERLQVERVMDELGIEPGAAVADIGAGSGWFTVRAARRVGAAGVVYAVDINKEYVEHIAARAADEQLPNVKAVLGTEDDPRLPKASVDSVLILKTYHEFSQPLAMMRRIREALRPGGRVGIIDRAGTGGDHGIDAEVVVSEMDRAGFRLVEEHDFVKPDDVDYFLVFEAR